MPLPRRYVLDAGNSVFHCVSRTAGREFLFGDAERELFRGILRKVEAFTGVKVLTWTILSNHFHVLLDVGEGPDAGMSDDELLRRLGKLYSRQHVREVREMFRHHDTRNQKTAKAQLRASYLKRMGSLSEFMKSLKQRFSSAFNRLHGRRGTLWEERFRASAVGGDLGAILTVAAYIDLNAVRAGLCKDPKDYRWSGYAEAVAGDKAARRGLAKILEDYGESGHWTHVGKAYRRVLFGAGEETAERLGISAEEVAAELARGGGLSTAQLLRCKVRYFTDGLAIGSRAFVESFFEKKREAFGPKRTSGARKMRGGDWKGMCTARDLRKDAVSAPS